MSDGCSSSEFATEAAKANVTAVMNLFQSLPLSEFLEFSIDRQKEVIHQACVTEINKIPTYSYSECCATLVFLVFDNQDVLVGHIGDGAVFCFDKDNHHLMTSLPENGIDSRHTHFTVEPDLDYTHLARFKTSELHTAILTSDGACHLFEKYSSLSENTVAKQISQWVCDNKITNCLDLRECVIGITSDMLEHFDDWSLLILAPHQEMCEDIPQEAISMKKDVLKKLNPNSYKEQYEAQDTQGSSADAETEKKNDVSDAVHKPVHGKSAETEEVGSEHSTKIKQVTAFREKNSTQVVDGNNKVEENLRDSEPVNVMKKMLYKIVRAITVWDE